MGSSPISATSKRDPKGSRLIIRPVGQEVKTPPFHGSNTSSILVRVTNKKRTFVYQKFSFCLSKPQAWYIIDAQSAAYIISPVGAVSHHALVCICMRLDDIPQRVADDTQTFVLMVCNGCAVDFSDKLSITNLICLTVSFHTRASL